jgi:acyl-CoA thioesterase FadM
MKDVTSGFCVIAGVCITTDVDTLLYHMNNARYLRELDFARVDFYERSGLYKRIRQKGGAVVQGACTIRYRRFVRPFSVFKITSKVNRNRGETCCGFSVRAEQGTTFC